MPEKSSEAAMRLHKSTPAALANFYQRVYTLVRQVPAGQVVTYGQVAALLGSPRAARAVGYALRYLPLGSDVPWHRVINHRGGISPRYPADSPLLQRLLLEAEGVRFDAQDCVDLARYRWHPAALEAKNPLP
jgi:methylated-DNA-protein-cysteine methyltransferase-like protein